MTTEELVKRLTALMEERPETKEWEVGTEILEEWPRGRSTLEFEIVDISKDGMVMLN